MKKFRRAVFCVILLRIAAAGRAVSHAAFTRVRITLWQWILTLRISRRRDGFVTIGDDMREWIAEWALNDLFKKPMDFDTVLHILGGDKHYERNKRDIAKLERETGKNIIEIWDTDPIFAKYPHLRPFARNKEFEKMWANMKQKVK